ncbi:hypothetical protein [Mycobacteroides salmoniphilum]|uniref:hypothetical protein n=1 Tax=Mycobacteroides salmoniphilum TaxID=404941 RepID=UPI001430C38B|nr:hypothetical protein [Mycobacteroides salmoniphilum]
MSEPMSLEERRIVWRSVGTVPALVKVAGLFAELDLAVLENQRATVERSHVLGIRGDLKRRLNREIDRGRAIFTNTSLVQCIKEIIEFSDEGSSTALSITDLTLCTLGISHDQDTVDADLMARVMHPVQTDLQSMLDDFTEVALDWAAQHLFDFPEPFELLAGSADETWRRGWSPRTGAGTVQGLGDGPADLFAATYGVDLDDFLAFGWGLWAQVRGGGGVRFDPSILTDSGINGKVIDLFVKTCTVSLGALRGEIVAERTSEITNTWMRYTLQNTPFVQLSDGSFVMLRLQYAVQRVFGDLLALKLHDAVKAVDTGRASRFKAAMNDIFEHRVGEVLARIAKHEARFGGAEIIDDPAMKAAWAKKGQNEKICDFVYAQRKECIVIDANNRNLPRQFAERTASGSELVEEIRNMFAATKFEQLKSTIMQFRAKGWDRNGVHIDDQTKFIPLVVAPNAGMPANAFTEMLVMQHAVPMIAEFNSAVLPPAIISWRDLQLLEGISETGAGRIIELVVAWRLFNYRNVTQGLGFPSSLSDFVDSHFTFGLPVAKHDREAALATWGWLRDHALRHIGNEVSDPWTSEHIGSDRFRFTNVSGGRLAMIVLAPIGNTEVKVEDGVESAPHVVSASIENGGSFVAVLRGVGTRITATEVPSMTHRYWELLLP